MKKGNVKGVDELRPEYKRSDLGEIVRGKYAARLAVETNVVILEPKIAKAFPNDKAVNDALRSLIKATREADTAPPLRKRRALSIR
jgi:hypothetical protein